MRYERWNVHGYSRDTAVALVHSGINPLPAVILASRGFSDADSAAAIFDCSLSGLHDPFLLTDMDKAVQRIRRAVNDREKIIVFGDYDVDGMTSSCVMYEYLKSIGAEVGVYIPGRLDEGYGLNIPALKSFADDGVRLVITVDCGVTAVEEAVRAKELGIDLIITDHHECKSALPDAVAVVDPKRQDCPYPNKNLAGVGVAFKTICALAGTENVPELMATYGELAALGTIADVVPICGENRILTHLGLEQLKNTERPGLQHLLHETGLDTKRITTGAIGFSLAPRLNAAGRMGRPELSVALLGTRDPQEASQIAAELHELNEERRGLVSRIYDEALAMAEGIEGPLILSSHDWYQGVMGIVAARIAEVKMVPTITICLDSNGVGRGSCRSYGGFPLYAALEHCSDLLTNFGGHEMAAGITVREENIPALMERFCCYYYKQVTTAPVPSLEIDLEVVKPGLLSLENLSALGMLEPYGVGNLPPVLCLRNATLTSISSVGNGAHTKIRINKNGESFDCIFFSCTVQELGVRPGDRIDIAFEPQINEFRGRRSVQLLLADVKFRR